MTSEPQATAKPAVHWLTLGQFSLSLIAIGILWFFACLAAIAGFFGLLSTSTLAGDITSFFIYAASLGFIGLLLVPSAYYAFLRLRGRQASWHVFKSKRRFKFGLLIILFPIVLLAGSIVIQTGFLTWLLLPPLHILAILIPIVWLFYLGSRSLPIGSPQRASGVLGSGMVLSPFLASVLQMLILAGFGVVVILYLSARPDLMEEIINLITHLGIMERYADPTYAPEMLLEIMRPYVQGPGVVYGALIFVAVLVPMIEEMVKPIGVLFLTGSALSPAGGFVAGMLSGAGFALFESLLIGSAADWAITVQGRAGSAVVHIMTAGLVGFALAAAWRKRSYLQLGLAYFLAVVIHGLWNALALLNLSYPFFIAMPEIPSYLSTLAMIAPLVLAFMALEMFVYLLWANYRLRKSGGKLQPVSKSVL
jgi:hypothetical protein